jgi:hypothetical protein
VTEDGSRNGAITDLGGGRRGINVDKTRRGNTRRLKTNRRKVGWDGKRKGQAELWNLTNGIVLDLSHPFKETTAITQVRAKHVIATARHATIMISSLPCLIAATVKSEVLNMNTKPPQAKKNPARASVGGRLGRVERGGPNHRKR